MTTDAKNLPMAVVEHHEGTPPGTSHRLEDAAPPQEEHLNLRAAVRLYPKVAGWCMALTTAIILWGYDMVIVGSITAVPAFQRDYGVWSPSEDEYIFPATWLGLWSASSPLGSTFGSIAGGFIQDRIGRKKSLNIGSLICVAGIFVIFFSQWVEHLDSKRGAFFAGKVIQGFATGIIKVQCLTWISENAPTALRGSAMALVPTFTLLGQLIGAVVIYSINDVESAKGYLIALGSQWVLSIAPFVLSLIMPESPAYLIRRGQDEAAMCSVERLVAPKVDPVRVFQRTKYTIEKEALMADEVLYADCFNKAHIRRTGIVIFANFMPSLFGLDLLATASYFLQVVGMDSGLSLIFLIVGIVLGMLANGGSLVLLTRVGRRRLTISTISIAGLLYTGMGVAGCFSGDVTIWYSAVSLNLVILACGLGCWPAAYAIMGETSALRLRAKTQAVGGVAQQVASIVFKFVLPYIFNPDAGNLRAKTGFLYTGFCTIGAVVTWLLVPEMKDRNALEIDHMFDIGLKARQFKGWQGQVGEQSEDVKTS